MDRNGLFGRDDAFYATYGVLTVFYGGQFIGPPISYVGGECVPEIGVDAGRINTIMVLKLVEKVIMKSVKSCNVYYKSPEDSLEELCPLSDDDSIRDILEIVKTDKKFEVYVDYEETMHNVIYPVLNGEEDEVNVTGDEVVGVISSAVVDEVDLVNNGTNVNVEEGQGTVEIVCTRESGAAPLKFQRMYFCLGVIKDGWKNGCRSVIGIDGCFLKGVCRGVLLVAIGRDGNGQMYPIAWSVVESENLEAWTWFLYLLKKDLELQEGDGLTITSD